MEFVQTVLVFTSCQNLFQESAVLCWLKNKYLTFHVLCTVNLKFKILRSDSFGFCVNLSDITPFWTRNCIKCLHFTII